MSTSIIETLEDGGVKSPLLIKMPWGIYWHEDMKVVEPQDMREGHVREDGVVMEWTDKLGEPVPFNVNHMST